MASAATVTGASGAGAGSTVDVEAGAGIKRWDGRPSEQSELTIPGNCSNACAFNTMVFMCCAVTIIFPIICLAVLAPAEARNLDRAGTAAASLWQWIALGCFVLGLSTCCFFSRKVWCGGVFCMPRAPPAQPPLVMTNKGDRQHEKIEVSKVYAIVNPHSGLQRSGSVLDLCKKVWGDANIEVEVVLTQRAGHATELARTLPTAGYQGIVILGGDGSLFEAANGMLARPEAERIPLALVPGGSGNSVLRDLEVIGHTEAGEREAAQRVARGDVCWIDVNEVTVDDTMRYYSVNEVTWGLGGAAAAAQYARCLGPARYDICAVWGILKGPSDPLRIVVDDSTTLPGPVATCYVNQTQYFGKGLRAAPEATLDDGKCNLYVVPPQSRGGIFQIFQQMPTGAHLHSKLVKRYEANKVDLYPGAPGTINIDGENFPFKSKITVRCLHKQLQMFVPPTINSDSAGALSAQKSATAGSPLLNA